MLDLGNTPESMEGIRILREWIWQACDRLVFSAPPRVEYIESFIPEFMAACTMAYDFDFERAKVYVPRTRMCRYGYKKWPACLTRPGFRVKSQLIVRDFVELLQGGERNSLILGTLYLRYVSQSLRVQDPLFTRMQAHCCSSYPCGSWPFLRCSGEAMWFIHHGSSSHHGTTLLARRHFTP